MKKFLPILFTVLLFFLLTPRAFATWRIRTDPQILFRDTREATFTIYSDSADPGEALQPPVAQYGFWIFKAGDGKISINGTPIHGIFRQGNGKTVTIPQRIPIRNAFTLGQFGSPPRQGVQGSWHIVFCKMRLYPIINLIPTDYHIACETTIFDGNVTVNPPGSITLGLPAIEILGKTFKYGDSVDVKLLNPTTDTTYTIWWYAPTNYAAGVIAGSKKFTESELSTASFRIRTPSPSGIGNSGVYNLCMTPNAPPWGSNFTFGLACDYHIDGIYITPDAAIATGAPRDPVRSNDPGVPTDDSGSSGATNSLLCDQYVDTTTGEIIPTDDPRLANPDAPKECVPGALGPCAEYVYPQLTIVPTGMWGHPIPTGQVESIPYKQCAKIDTALGPVAVNPGDFIKSLFGILLGISGGIAILLIISAGYTLITSQGEATKVQGARETITSAIVGLLFIIFSLVVLEIIGYDLLHLPGFGR